MQQSVESLLSSPPPLRIALTTPYNLSVHGGVNANVLATYGELRNRGHEVKVFGPLNGRFDLEGIIEDKGLIPIGRFNIPVHNNGTISNINVFSFLWPLTIYQIRKHFDVVHIHEPATPFFHPILVSSIGRHTTANIATFHSSGKDSWTRSAYSGTLSLTRFKKLAARNLHRRLAVSRVAEDYIQGHFPGEYQIVPNPVDADRFTPDGERVEYFNGMMVFDTSKVNILFVGRQEPRKGFRYLAEAFRNLWENPDYRGRVRLIAAGSGDIDEASKSFLGQLPEDDCVLVGEVPAKHLPAFYRSADIFVAPSVSHESQGIVIHEAQASKTPVIATDIDGYIQAAVGDVSLSREEARTRERKGVVTVEPRNAAELEAQLRYLIDRPGLRLKLGAEGRRIVEERFSVSVVVDMLEGIYYRTLSSLSLQNSNFARRLRVA